MIRFTSAKFQLNIHEVFILLGLKHLHHQSFEGGCCGEGHFFGDLLEGNENEQKKKKEERGGRKNTRKVTDKMESKRLHSAELGYSRAVPSPYVAKCVVKLTINAFFGRVREVGGLLLVDTCYTLANRRRITSPRLARTKPGSRLCSGC